MVVAMLLPLLTQAQIGSLLSFTNAQPRWGFNPHLTPAARIDLPAHQKLMGHYSSDSIADQGYAMLSAGLQPVAIMMEPDELDVFQGGKIVAIRVGLVQPAEVTRVFVIPVKANGKYGDKSEWLCDVNAAGWNTVELETPYEINLNADEKLLVGFYFRQIADASPLSFVKVGKPYDTYTYKKVGTSARWRELGLTDNGNLSVQCIVEKEDFPEYSISTYNLRSNDYVQIGEDLPFALEVKNKGTKTVESGKLTVNMMIDGQPVGTATNADAFSGDYYTLQAGAPTDGLESGDHVLSVQVVEVDGVALENMPTFEHAFKAYRQGFPRQKHLVEQLTSTYCTWCPLGNSMLKVLTSQRKDVIWVGIHGNLGGVDPFKNNQCDTIMSYLTGGSVSYPSGAFDRSTGWDSPTTIVSGLGYYEEYHQMAADALGEFFDYVSEAMPTFVQIKGECQFNEETRQATVKVSGGISPDFNLMLGEDSRLTVYLIQDSLVASQLNQGTWEPNYMHNGVFRKALGSALGNPLNITGDHYENVYTTTIPSSWNWKNMRAVAFVSRPLSNAVNGFTDLFVNNAEVFSFYQETMTGDVNGDQEINIADINALIDMILSGEEQPVADVNGDSEVNIADINAVIDMILQ